ncbi:MAG: SpoVR family protein [Deltaproteobacteria bacterium]|nr:SpoVR family protein [Deltaproteobacteria bacterium]
MTLPPELCRMRDELRGYAVGYGLDFFEVIFEMLDWRQINEVAAFGGFPNRYPHWRFGMEYEELAKSYTYGLSKIYEMVINNDPCYAYLLHSNNLVDQKLVMAHVYAHSDFFKNNVYFGHTNRKMMDEMANHRTRVMRYIDRIGYDKVEAFIDACLSLETLIDYHGAAIRRAPARQHVEHEEGDASPVVRKLGTGARHYMERYLNPPEFMEAQQQKLVEERQREKNFPERPQRDVLQFLTDFAPLESWERDLLSIVREEAVYFSPQAQTKIMNEGWASYWHSTIMTQRALKDSEVIDYADHHAGVVAMTPQRINPYKIGIELYRDIEDRWNRGRFGKEYDECTDMRVRAKWDRQLGLGRQKIFEVRKIYNDITFLDEFLTPEFCREHRMFVYAYNLSSDQFEIADRTFEKIKKQLLNQLTNAGQPTIDVVDANYGNRGELLLKHQHDGVDLRFDYAQETLKNLFRIWRRPVNIESVVEGVPKILSYDGQGHKEFRP